MGRGGVVAQPEKPAATTSPIKRRVEKRCTRRRWEYADPKNNAAARDETRRRRAWLNEARDKLLGGERDVFHQHEGGCLGDVAGVEVGVIDRPPAAGEGGIGEEVEAGFEGVGGDGDLALGILELVDGVDEGKAVFEVQSLSGAWQSLDLFDGSLTVTKVEPATAEGATGATAVSSVEAGSSDNGGDQS